MLAASLLSLGTTGTDRAGRLVTLGAALLFLFAGDWGTLALAWVLVDIGLLYTLGQRTEQAESLAWSGVLSLAGAAMLGVALLLWQQVDGSLWVDQGGSSPIQAVAASDVPPTVAGLLILATTCRFLPFPLPAWRATGAKDMPEPIPVTQTMVFVVPLLLAVTLWTRLAQWNVLAQSGHWLSVLSICAWVGLLISAFKAWSAHEPDDVISLVRTCGGLNVLMGASLGLQAEWQLLVGTNLILSLSSLSLSWQQCQYLEMRNPRSYWRAAPASLGVLSLAGTPLLIGFPARVAIYWSIFQAHKWLLLLGLMSAEALVIGALLRTILDVEGVPESPLPRSGQEPLQDIALPISGTKPQILTRLSTFLAQWAQGLSRFLRNSIPDVLWSELAKISLHREIAYVAGSSLAIGLLILGIMPGVLWPDGTLRDLGYWFGMPRLPVWAALLLPVVGGVVLYRQQDVTLVLVQDWGRLLGRLTAVDWVYRAAENGLSRVRALIWGATQVIEGAGYMAWVLVVCLVLLLLVISR
jgi:hypothetical protein